MLSNKFPWYFVNGISYKKDGDYQFVHNFADKGNQCSKYYSMTFPILKKINVERIFRIKANLTKKNIINRKSPMHVDLHGKGFKTAVYYCNTNNGSTLFKNGKSVKSKKNRILIFDGDLKHCGVDCTDKEYRLVINFNYLEKL